jgi:galactose-1-phosphate uridylyltransferase
MQPHESYDVMRRMLKRETLEKLVQSNDITVLSLDQITELFLTEDQITPNKPDGVCQMDPRTGDRIIYNTARARRPHDNLPIKNMRESQEDVSNAPCLICEGQTTHVVDVAPLSEGFTFINKNLFPIFFPNSEIDPLTGNLMFTHPQSQGVPVQGFHFLQWTSSFHDKDWHNMAFNDRMIVAHRLAALEKKMLTESDKFVSIIKNYGRLVGGSLAHGHQQITVSNIMPNRIRQNKDFQEKYGETFSAYMLRENPSELIIKDYGKALLITPYFMRRPYDMMLLLKDTKKGYLHLLNEDDVAAIANGWRDAIRIMLHVMPQIGKETAYNVTTHNGPGAGLYFEFLPYTQETGGFEHLGLYLCQGNPVASAQLARKILTTLMINFV